MMQWATMKRNGRSRDLCQAQVITSAVQKTPNVVQNDQQCPSQQTIIVQMHKQQKQNTKKTQKILPHVEISATPTARVTALLAC